MNFTHLSFVERPHKWNREINACRGRNFAHFKGSDFLVSAIALLNFFDPVVWSLCIVKKANWKETQNDFFEFHSVATKLLFSVVSPEPKLLHKLFYFESSNSQVNIKHNVPLVIFVIIIISGINRFNNFFTSRHYFSINIEIWNNLSSSALYARSANLYFPFGKMRVTRFSRTTRKSRAPV